MVSQNNPSEPRVNKVKEICLVQHRRSKIKGFHTGKGVCKAQSLAGVTNEHVSEVMGVSRMQVHRYRSQADMHFGKMCKIAELCNMSIYDLIKECEE